MLKQMLKPFARAFKHGCDPSKFILQAFYFYLQRLVLFLKGFDFEVIISCQYFFPKAELSKACLHGTRTVVRVYLHVIEVMMKPTLEEN